MTAYSLEEALHEMETDVRIYLEKKEDGTYSVPENRRLPFYLIGAPGIGKTEGVQELAERLGIGFYATSITHHTRQTIVGLPLIVDRDTEPKTIYTMSDLIAVVQKLAEGGAKEGLLLIDEFASMSDSLVAPMLAFLQTKRIGNYRLPEGWLLVLCSNPPEFNETARTFDAAVMDRVRVLEIRYNQEDFLSYGEKAGIHPVILDFVRSYPTYAYSCRSLEDGSREIVTARSWENLSYILKGYEAMEQPVDERLVKQFIKSDTIGTAFYRYYSLSRTVVPAERLERVLKGEKVHETAAKLKPLSFDRKWQVCTVLSGLLLNDCRDYSEHIRMYDKMNSLQNRIRAVRKNEEPDYQGQLGDFLGLPQAQMVNMFFGSGTYGAVSGNGSTGGRNVFGTEEDRKDQHYVSALKKLYHAMDEKVRARQGQISGVGNPGPGAFGGMNAGGDDTAFMVPEQGIAKKDVLDLLKGMILDYSKEILKEQNACDGVRTNAFTFVKEMSGDEQMLQAFLRGYNQQDVFMRIEAYRPNRLYHEMTAKMYATA